MSFFGNLFADSNQKVIDRYKKSIDQINSLEKEFEAKSQDELKALTLQWKEKLKDQSLEETKDYLNELLPQAYAAVREAAKRTIGQRHYDVQLMGGIALHQGSISEMRTGEGK